MTIIRKIGFLVKKKINFLSLLDIKALRIRKFNSFILISFLVFFSLIFFITSNLIDKKNKENESNFKEITKTDDFINLTNFLISKINSPYKEISYVIKKNDTVEKILNQFEIRKEDINIISLKLKKKNSLIYILEESFP